MGYATINKDFRNQSLVVLFKVPGRDLFRVHCGSRSALPKVMDNQKDEWPR